ncbi:transposase [Streptomyces sp. A7024]|uniref:Transposase n=1 Tax=Streptomyces coryli TaxID=1128680 RepID=A0A6G4U089_9ACTN|nr:transposase [Streptomyces coryli]NGN64697.1 transposase [Streptomyces coryli]
MPQRPPPDLPELPALLDEWCEHLFASFPRRDQREKGRLYLRGLLTAHGRKSIRHIAGDRAGTAQEQRLQHFITGSTWPWMPVRAALADRLAGAAPPAAHVVRPLSLPRSGTQSVGIARRYDPYRGLTYRGQQAIGVWHTTARLSAPVHWRLLLPGDHPAAETIQDCAAAAVMEATRLTCHRRPVILDLPATGTALDHLTTAGLPALARTSTHAACTIADPALRGYTGRTLPARRILALRARLRHRTPGAVTVRVTLPHRSGHVLHLFATGSAPPHLWLANTHAAPSGSPTALVARVRQDLARIGTRVGLADFEGRSLAGWHRHITLASAAHAATVLALRTPEAAPATTTGAVRHLA